MSDDFDEETDESTEAQRTHLHSALQDTVGMSLVMPEGAVLTGFVTIAEYVSPSGQRWLRFIGGDASGDSLAWWTAQGWMFNILHEGVE